MRVFCEYTVQKKEDSGVDELLPEISKFCFYLRKYYDLMGEAIEDEERDSCEFIVEQLLLLSNVFDFSDEVGRRAMFSMLREDSPFSQITLPPPKKNLKRSLVVGDLFGLVDLPEGFVSKMVDIMYRVSQDEAEFTRFASFSSFFFVRCHHFD
jgi:hypothetical protein